MIIAESLTLTTTPSSIEKSELSRKNSTNQLSGNQLWYWVGLIETIIADKNVPQVCHPAYFPLTASGGYNDSLF